MVTTGLSTQYVDRLVAKYHNQGNQLTPKQVAALKIRFAAEVAMAPYKAVFESTAPNGILSEAALRYRYCTQGLAARSDAVMLRAARNIVAHPG